MSEIHYKEIENHLKSPGREGFPSVYLLYGEEFLCKAALEALLNVLVPVSERSFNYEPFDGANEPIAEAVEKVNTFSLLSGNKVVAIRDSQIFYSKEDTARLLEKAKQEYEKNDIQKASKYFLSLLGMLHLSFDDVGKADREKTLRLDLNGREDDEWIDKIIGHCKENNLTVPAGEDPGNFLEHAIEKGFPKGNHLIITTDRVDKRRSLYKIINEKGMIIDCFVPKGERRADKMAQEVVLKEMIREMLGASGKRMSKGTYSAIYEMTGFDLRTFSNNLQKLIDYVGNRNDITMDDVESVLKRTKQDPIFELTNAVSDRNAEESLFFLNSLLSGGFHPLQIFAAITNQIRKLLLVKDFVESTNGGVWKPDCRYPQFQVEVMPAIKEYDEKLLKQLQDWEKMLSKNSSKENETRGKGKKKKKKASTDLMIASNPKNVFPVFKTLQKSAKFTKDELLGFVERLSEVDLQLKSTGREPKFILEEAILLICRKEAI